MIIEALLGIIYDIMDFLLVFDIPNLPAKVHESIALMQGEMQIATSLVNEYCDLGYLFTLLGIIVAVDIAIGVYHLVMWILKKIPMLSIK